MQLHMHITKTLVKPPHGQIVADLPPISIHWNQRFCFWAQNAHPVAWWCRMEGWEKMDKAKGGRYLQVCPRCFNFSLCGCLPPFSQGRGKRKRYRLEGSATFGRNLYYLRYTCFRCCIAFPTKFISMIFQHQVSCIQNTPPITGWGTEGILLRNSEGFCILPWCCWIVPLEYLQQLICRQILLPQFINMVSQSKVTLFMSRMRTWQKSSVGGQLRQARTVSQLLLSQKGNSFVFLFKMMMVLKLTQMSSPSHTTVNWAWMPRSKCLPIIRPHYCPGGKIFPTSRIWRNFQTGTLLCKFSNVTICPFSPNCPVFGKI